MSYPFLKRFRIDEASKMKLPENIIEARKSYQKHIESGEYSFENKPCICNSNSDVLISEIDRHGLYYPLVICKNCGLMRANPRLDERSLLKFYDSEYRELYGENESDKEQIWSEKVEQGRITFERIMSKINLKRGAVVFEIGCNMGATLSVFKEKGYKVYGFDYGSRNIEFGNSKLGEGPLFVGGLDKALSVGIKADLIIFVHVYEHLSNLAAENEKIKKLLKDDGYLYIDVSGTYWWINHIYRDITGLLQNAHNYQFTLASLKYVMSRSGFGMVSGNEQIKAIFQKKSDRKTHLPAIEANKILLFLWLMNIYALLRKRIVKIVKSIIRK